MKAEHVSMFLEETPIGYNMEVKSKTKEKSKWPKDRELISLHYDKVDDIYKEEDPIEASLKMRMNWGGRKTSVIRDYYSKSGKFFFSLTFKEPKDLLVVMPMMSKPVNHNKIIPIIEFKNSLNSMFDQSAKR